MERFGLHVSGQTAGMGGVPLDVLQGLFDRYDTDASGVLSYPQFASGVFGVQQGATKDPGANPMLPSLAGGDENRPATRLGNADRPSTASLAYGDAGHTRGRSMANPGKPTDPDAYKKHNNIFG